MRRLAGQAAHHGIASLLTVAVLLGLGFIGLGKALSEHPVPVPWLVPRLEQAADATLGPGALTIGSAAIGWDGFRQGGGNPLAIRVRHVTARTPQGSVLESPEASVELELLPLLHGLIRPVAVRFNAPRIAIDLPPASGAPQSPRDVVQAFLNARPFASLPRWATSVRSLRLDAATLTVRNDKAFPPLAGIDAELERSSRDRFSSHVELSAMPAALAASSPALAPLGRLKAELALNADATFDLNGQLQSARLVAKAQPGTVRLGSSPVALLAATAALDWVREQPLSGALELLVRPGEGEAPANLRIAGRASLTPGNVAALEGTATLDQVRMADLDRLWPAEIAADARKWLVDNVTDGVATALRSDFTISVPPHGAPVVSALSGTLSGTDLVVHWLRPVPPIERAAASVRILDPDKIEIAFKSGLEPVPGARDPLRLTGGYILISGLTAPDQIARIDAQIEGPIQAGLGLLSDPALHLLADHPLQLDHPAGQASLDLGLTLPLDNRVTMDQVRIEASARLRDVSISKLVGGAGLTGARIRLAGNPDGLSFEGDGALGGIPADFSGMMDFRAGPPSQAVQRIEAHATASVAALAAWGLDTDGLLSGSAELDAAYVRQRNGTASVDLRAGLDHAGMRFGLLGWEKPTGRPAELSARAVLDVDGRLRSLEDIEGAGDGFALHGSARLSEQGAVRFSFDRLRLGRTEARGTLTTGVHGEPLTVSIAGPLLDLGPCLRKLPSTGSPSGGSAQGWTVDARFGQALVARGRALSDFRLNASGTGANVRNLELHSETSPGEPVQASIAEEGGGRTLKLVAADGGSILGDLGITGDVEGGKLDLRGQFDDAKSDGRLRGILELDGFRIRGAMTLGKVLQAASLYGLTQALDGPGMAFTHLVVPFAFGRNVITLDQARAFNPSLGITARGDVDMQNDRLHIAGTIVPAYYLNTALGRLPVVGRLFSPERGGGLIAAQYVASGPLDNPAVSVNPLSVLTPGFLRGVFGQAR